MSKRVTPSERLRAEVDEVFAGGADLASAIEQVARIGARLLLLQTAIEAEATAFLGRERYARAASCDDAREGSRNRLLRDRHQDHDRAGDAVAAEAARHYRVSEDEVTCRSGDDLTCRWVRRGDYGMAAPAGVRVRSLTR